jgi:hypothetical protein
MRIQFQMASLLQQTSVQIVGLGIMGFMTLRRSQKSDGNIYGFLFGFGLLIVARHLLNLL